MESMYPHKAEIIAVLEQCRLEVEPGGLYENIIVLLEKLREFNPIEGVTFGEMHQLCADWLGHAEFDHRDDSDDKYGYFDVGVPTSKEGTLSGKIVVETEEGKP